MITKTFNKTEAVNEISAANFPQELATVVIDVIKNAVEDTEVTMTTVCKDMFRISFASTKSENLIKEFESASVYVATICYITTVTIFKKRK